MPAMAKGTLRIAGLLQQLAGWTDSRSRRAVRRRARIGFRFPMMKNAPRTTANRDPRGLLSAGGIRSVGFDTALSRGPIDFPHPGPLRSRSRRFRIRRSYSRDQRPRDRFVGVEPSTNCSSLASPRRALRPRLTVRSDASAKFTWWNAASIEKFFRRRQARRPGRARARPRASSR